MRIPTCAESICQVWMPEENWFFAVELFPVEGNIGCVCVCSVFFFRLFLCFADLMVFTTVHIESKRIFHC